VNTVFIILYEIIYRIMLFIKQSIMPISLFSLFLLRSCICSQFHYIQALLSAKDVLLSNPCLTYVFIYISNFFIILIINIIKNIQRRSRKKMKLKNENSYRFKSLYTLTFVTITIGNFVCLGAKLENVKPPKSELLLLLKHVFKSDKR